jgi:hypothetical protein
MFTKDLTGTGPSQFDSGAVAVAATGDWVQVALLKLAANRKSMCLDMLVGANAITHLKFTRTGSPAGAHVDLAVDAAINTATPDIPSALPSSISTLSAAGIGSVRLSGLRGVQEIGVWAQAAADTTIQIHGTVMD